jgi:hypothetical protein
MLYEQEDFQEFGSGDSFSGLNSNLTHLVAQSGIKIKGLDLFDPFFEFDCIFTLFYIVVEDSSL